MRRTCTWWKEKAEVIHFNNKTNVWVDSLDQFIGTYICIRKVNLWPVVVLSNIMNILPYNTFVIYSEIFPSWDIRLKYKTRIFREELWESQVKEEIVRRKRMSQWSKGADLVKSLQSSQYSPGEKRWKYYIYKNDRTYPNKYNRCKRFQCSNHCTVFTKYDNCNFGSMNFVMCLFMVIDLNWFFLMIIFYTKYVLFVSIYDPTHIILCNHFKLPDKG